MPIDIETARKVARLARIAVAEDRLPALASEFGAIVDFVAQIRQADTEGVDPMVSVTPMALRQRSDTVEDANPQDAILKNAPDTREGFFTVPKVVE